MDVFSTIKTFLEKNHIDYTLTEHQPVRTSEEAARVRGVPLKTGAKAMVVKAKDQFILVVLSADRRIDWKKLKNILGVNDIRLATEEEAEKVTGVKMALNSP